MRKLMPIEAPKPDVWGLRKPKIKAPPGMVDTHFHVFGPETEYPYLPTRTFTPPDASEVEYRHVCHTLGIDRAVLVQPSGYGRDNRRQFDAIANLDIPTRVVVVVHDDISDRELHDLHDMGARGVRIVTIQEGGLPLPSIERLAGRIAELDWNIEFLLTPDVLLQLRSRLQKLRCNFVVGNMAGLRAGDPDNPTIVDALKSLLDTGYLWIKLFGAYRMSALHAPYTDLMGLFCPLIQHRCDRFVWGTDWPHVVLDGRIPNTADTLDFLQQWIPDEVTRKQILVGNPERLYGFDHW
jgi:2-pyrone-4,6-dicarboxylate lactonase